MKFAILILCALFSTPSARCGPNSLKSSNAEIDTTSSDIKELEAINSAWLEISDSEVRLISQFRNVAITTFFKRNPSDSALSLNLTPTRQEFEFHLNGQFFVAVKCENRLWNDGVSGYSFRYENMNIEHDGKQYTSAFVTINDQGEEASIEARYTLYAKLEE